MSTQESRAITLFNLRYAVRVLERYARLWHRIGMALRIAAVMSGMSALGVVWAQAAGLTIAAGAVFAALQALDFVLDAPRREMQALLARAAYAGILGRGRALGDDELAAAYDEAVAADTLVVPGSIQRLAYNDVIEERGDDPAALYPVTRLLRVMQLVA